MKLMAALVCVAALAAPLGAQAWPLDAIGRLVVDDAVLCTAFVVRSEGVAVPTWWGAREVIYRNWLVTAGHCAEGRGRFSFRPARGGTVWGERVVGFSAGSQHDVAVLWVHSYQALPTLEPAWDERLEAGARLLLVGYGRGAMMARVGSFLGYAENGDLTVESTASPGNSGGPVIIAGTRRVVGIAVRTNIKPAPAAACLFGLCVPIPPYYAVPIDRVKGVIKWEEAAP